MELSDKFLELVQASTDARALDLKRITLHNETINEDAVLSFVKALPEECQEGLLEQNHPTDIARSRCLAACMLKGYGDANLVHFARRELNPYVSLLLHALACMSSEIVILETLPDGYDIRGFLAQAVVLSIDEFEKNVSLTNLGIEKSSIDKLIIDIEGLRTCNQAVYAMKSFIASHSGSLDELVDELLELVWAITDSSKLDSMEVTCIDKLFKHASYPQDHDFEKHHTQTAIKHDPTLELSSFFRPKMSIYMNRIWDHQCDAFFENSTRDDFLASLREYRKTLQNCEYLTAK